MDGESKVKTAYTIFNELQSIRALLKPSLTMMMIVKSPPPIKVRSLMLEKNSQSCLIFIPQNPKDLFDMDCLFQPYYNMDNQLNFYMLFDDNAHKLDREQLKQLVKLGRKIMVFTYETTTKGN